MFKEIYNKITKFLKWKRSTSAILMVVILSVAIFGAFSISPVYAQTPTTVSLGGWLGGQVMDVVNSAAAALVYTVMLLVIMILKISGFFLDLSIQYSLTNFSQFTSNAGVVGIGWEIFRDLSNLVFIFLILWVAISTILGLQHGSAMGSVLRIVIAAVLINFSLFVTKAVVDIANIIALHFYNLIAPTADSSLSGVFMQALNPQSIFPGNSAPTGITETKVLFASFLGSIVMLVASWVFIAAAVMFVIRTIYLMLLMILSPFAFIAWVVPGMSGVTHDWWHKLFNQAFFAPIFMLMMYVIGYAIQHGVLFAAPTGAQTLSAVVDTFLPGGNVSTAPSAVGILVNYIMLLGMIIASLLVSHKLGAVGSETMIHWGDHIRGAGQSWVGGRLIGMPARALDERLGKSWIGNTAAGKTLREWTTIPLKDSKFGGHHSAEERHKEDLELETMRKETEEIAGAGKIAGTIGRGLDIIGAGGVLRRVGVEVPTGGSHNAEALVHSIEDIDKNGKAEIARQEALRDEAKKKAEADPTNVTLQTALKTEEGKLKSLQQRVADDLEKERGELQKILVKLTDHAFAELMPKNLLFTPEMMRNASRSQLMAVLNSDHFAEVEKDKVRAARYGHIKDANEKVKKANAEYDKKYQEYINKLDIITNVSESEDEKEAKIEKILDDLKLKKGSNERYEKYTAIHSAVDKYSDATNQDERQSAIKAGAEIFTPPTKKMIGDVAPDVRNWMRAMADQEADEMYRYNPQMVLEPGVAMTLRSSVTKFMRGSENVASIDKDKMRDAKFTDMIEAEDLVNGIGELAPSFKTFQHMIDNLSEAGAKDVDILKKLSEADYQKYIDDGKEWEQLKEDVLRKAVKKVAFDEGNYGKYLESFNGEQMKIAAMGEEKIISAIEGKSADEFTLLRGARWRNPAFAKYMNRGIAQEFRQKDTGDIKEVMDMVLFDMKNYLADNTKKISRANMDMLHWVATETSGKAFKNRDVINPELKETFDKMETIFSTIGRNPKEGLTLEKLQETVEDLKKAGKI